MGSCPSGCEGVCRERPGSGLRACGGRGGRSEHGRGGHDEVGAIRVGEGWGYIQVG